MRSQSQTSKVGPGMPFLDCQVAHLTRAASILGTEYSWVLPSAYFTQVGMAAVPESAHIVVPKPADLP